MRRRLVGFALAIAFVGLSICGTAAEIREVGLRVDLTLQPIYAGTAIHWNFDVGAYALVAFSEAWGVRLSAGFDVLSVGPYVGAGVLRALGSSFALEGDLLIQWSAHSSTPVATAGAGIRWVGATETLTYELGAFPVSWTLASVAGEPAVFSFSPSLTVGAGFALETGLRFGEAVTVTFLPVPSAGLRPVVPLGAGWMLSTRLTSHFGLDLAGL